MFAGHFESPSSSDNAIFPEQSPLSLGRCVRRLENRWKENFGLCDNEDEHASEEGHRGSYEDNLDYRLSIARITAPVQ